MQDHDLPQVRGEYRFNYPLAPITWFKVGGPAEIFFKPADSEDLSFFLQNLAIEISILPLGNCSNIIIRDGGISGIVIKLGRKFAEIKIENELLIVGAGSLNYAVASFAQQNGLGGLEFLIGIPGTIGGGIRMNAGAYGTEFKDILEYIIAIDRQGNIHKIAAKDVDFSYRHCGLPEDFIFTEAAFKFCMDSPDSIKTKMAEINSKRASSQPIKEKTGGSTFANPEGHKAWQLVDSVGMRGFQLGGAKFSELHCNFLINSDHATAKDIEGLGELARKKILEQTGVNLRWEIKRVGKYD